MNQTLHVRIISPQQLILDTNADSVSSKNSQGSFDILSEHANFITVIENQPIIIRIKGQKALTFKFPVAIIYVQQNKVDIYTYIQPQEQVKSVK
ncbi:hypothetical protein HYS92_01900 [Candidatus Daviesbacteria bacterium]|nr:hypothetical protein [Candidatus Daviesbacteria bacterium]